MGFEAVVAGRNESLRVAIIGAGMSGILAAIKLKNVGFHDVTIYERADRLGGTWRDNSYPGLTCDVPSHVYRYSFEPNPNWSRRFSPGSEILAYFEGVARKYDVDRAIRFNAEIVRAAFVDGRWHLEMRDGTRDVADFVIAATGVLRDPVYPAIDGLESFAGAAFHSSRWDHSVPLDGKRVGIIGTGSTAIQILPAIVDRVGKVSLFQRTAQWILGMENFEIPEDKKAGFRRSPQLMQAVFEDLSRRFVDTFSRAVLGDEAELKKVEAACRANLEENVDDPDLRARLMPDYKVACKRLIASNVFYPAIQKPNAALVTDGIERIEPGGVRTRDGVLHELDILVLATGFHAHRFMRPMRIVGRDGLTLDAAWAETAQAYRSVGIPGFPNFFMLIGPNSPIGNFSLISVSEMQLDYIVQLLDLAREGTCKEIEPRADATAQFNQAIRDAMPGTVWATGCRSWYLDPHGNPAMWPWSFDQFQADMAKPVLQEFELTG